MPTKNLDTGEHRAKARDPGPRRGAQDPGTPTCRVPMPPVFSGLGLGHSVTERGGGACARLIPSDGVAVVALDRIGSAAHAIQT